MNLTVQRVILTGVFALTAIGCNTFGHKPNAESRSPWLQRCDDDSQCGRYACLCGICSTKCDAAVDCRQSSHVAAICSTVPSDASDCPDVASDETLCIPDCSRGACGAHPEVMEMHPSGTIQPGQIDAVPRCPEVAQPGGLPSLQFTTDVESYEGAATVMQFAAAPRGTTVVLVPEGLADKHFDLRFLIQPPPYLVLDQRLQLLVRHGGTGSAKFDLIVVRDEAGKVLIAFHNGADELYSSGMFATSDTLGVSLTLRMTCQSPVEDGCFKDQIQAEYEGMIGADTSVAMSGPLKPTAISVEGTSYTASFQSGSVDGTAHSPSCPPEIMPARFLLFMMVRD